MLASGSASRYERVGRIIENDPGFYSALIMLAILYLDAENFVKAAKILEKGFQRTPHFFPSQTIKKCMEK